MFFRARDILLDASLIDLGPLLQSLATKNNSCPIQVECYLCYCLFPQRNTALQSRKLAKVKIFNWFGRPQNVRVFENECYIWNQRIKKQQDRYMVKKLRH